MTPLTHPAQKIDQVDSQIKDVGWSYMFKKKFINKKVSIRIILVIAMSVVKARNESSL